MHQGNVPGPEWAMTRNQLRASVIARLQRIHAAQDPALALEFGALDDAQRLAEILHEDDGDVEARYALGWLHWYGYLALPEGHDEEHLHKAIQFLTPCFVVGVEG